jgi:hypothetical protein
VCVCVCVCVLLPLQHSYLTFASRTHYFDPNKNFCKLAVMSLVSAKPPHRGRVLMDSASQGAKIPPVSSSSSSDSAPLPLMLPPAHVQANSGARLREALAENERLRTHLADAEQSIKNYRSIMSRTPQPERKNAYTQAGWAGESPRPNSGTEGERKFDLLEKVNTRLSRKNDDLARSLEDLSNQSATLSNENAELKELLLEEKAKVVSLENRLSAVNNSKLASANKNKRISANLLLELNKSKNSLDEIRKLHVEFVQLNDKYFGELKSSLTAHVSSFRHVLPQSRSALVDATVSPLRLPKPEGGIRSTSIATSPILWGAVEMEGEPASNISGADQEAVLMDEPAEAPLLIDQVNMSKNDAGEVPTDLTIQRTEVSSKYTTIKAALSDLSKLHRAEINAVKHTAHCKDLSRLATIRGITLERDRALNELRHAK